MKKPRKARRLRRRQARRWLAMSPDEQAYVMFYVFLQEEMMRELQEEVDRVILYGEGTAEPAGIAQ